MAITGRKPMDEISRYFWIMLGGAIGTAARFWCSGVTARAFGETFPWGTLIVNVTGSLIIGFFATITGPDGRIFAGTTARQFVMVGICGGYTTFSSFSIQTLNLMDDGEWLGGRGKIVLSPGFFLLPAGGGAIVGLPPYTYWL